jgi:hypothetical protein
MTDEGTRIVHLVARLEDTGATELPPEFLQLEQVLESLVAEARMVLEPQDRRLLDLHLGLFALSGGPALDLRQLALVLGVSANRLRMREEKALELLRKRLRLARHGHALQAVARAASAWSEVLGDPPSGAVVDAFATAGGKGPLLRFASILLGGLNSRLAWDSGAEQFEKIVLRVLARRGPLSVDELSRVVMALIPADGWHGERFDPALRIRLLAPVQRQADGKLMLPEEVPGGLAAEQRHARGERRLQAMIGALEERHMASVPQLVEALTVRLPEGDLPSEHSVRWLLSSRPDVFQCARRGYYELVENAAMSLLLDGSRRLVPDRECQDR